MAENKSSQRFYFCMVVNKWRYLRAPSWTEGDCKITPTSDLDPGAKTPHLDWAAAGSRVAHAQLAFRVLAKSPEGAVRAAGYSVEVSPRQLTPGAKSPHLDWANMKLALTRYFD